MKLRAFALCVCLRSCLIIDELSASEYSFFERKMNLNDVFGQFQTATDQLEKTEDGQTTSQVSQQLQLIKERLLGFLKENLKDQETKDNLLENHLSTINLNQDKRISQESMLLEGVVDTFDSETIICIHNQIKLAISTVNRQLASAASHGDDLRLARQLLEDAWLTVVNDANQDKARGGCNCRLLGLQTNVLVDFNQINQLVYHRLDILSTLIQLRLSLTNERDYFHELCSIAIAVYDRWKVASVTPFNSEQMFSAEKRTPAEEDIMKQKVESQFNQILECKMNVCCESGLDREAARICHRLLKRWLHVQDASKLKVAVHFASLSQYFSGKKNFAIAVHLIQSAFHVFDQFKKANIFVQSHFAELPQSEASIRLILIKYSIRLLEFSLENQSNLSSVESISSKTVRNAKVLKEYSVFSDQELVDSNQLYAIDSLLSTTVSTFEEARDLFKTAILSIDECQHFYSLEERCSDYVELEQDRATLYGLLAKFETDSSRKCKMLRKRVDILEKVLNKLNPTFYLNHVRKLNFELGEAYFDLLQSKEKQGKSTDADGKINRLCAKGIEKMHSFVQSFYEPDSKRLPDRIDDSVVSSVMTAYSMIGKLYERIPTHDDQQHVNHIEALLCSMQQVLNYAQQNPDQAYLIQQNVITAENYKELFMKLLQEVNQPTARKQLRT